MAKILLVDDDRSLADLVQYALERAGFEVVVAHTGQDALDAAQAHALDLVVLDVHLPDLNGFTVLSTLRTLLDAPVVMLTGSTRDEAGAGRRDVRPDDYLVKPFSVTMLLKRIEDVLRRFQTARGQSVQRAAGF
jgi:DNA-binding response OmpR family regulator